MANARELFERELQSRQFAFSIAEDGRYRIESGDGGTLLVSLDNIAREFERDRDAALIERFVDRVLSPLEVPGWERARSQIYWSAERFDNDFGDTLRETVSDTV